MMNRREFNQVVVLGLAGAGVFGFSAQAKAKPLDLSKLTHEQKVKLAKSMQSPLRTRIDYPTSILDKLLIQIANRRERTQDGLVERYPLQDSDGVYRKMMLCKKDWLQLQSECMELIGVDGQHRTIRLNDRTRQMLDVSRTAFPWDSVPYERGSPAYLMHQANKRDCGSVDIPEGCVLIYYVYSRRVYDFLKDHQNMKWDGAYQGTDIALVKL